VALATRAALRARSRGGDLGEGGTPLQPLTGHGARGRRGRLWLKEEAPTPRTRSRPAA
jgi:hypothetical protein